jgi:hypothetical protein
MLSNRSAALAVAVSFTVGLVASLVILQLIGLANIFNWEAVVTWLPAQAYGN